MKHGGTGKEHMMNKASEEEPKSGHRPPAVARGGSEVGEETKAHVQRAQGEAGGMAGNMGHAVRELKRQHPEAHDDHGPHHGKLRRR